MPSCFYLSYVVTTGAYRLCGLDDRHDICPKIRRVYYFIHHVSNWLLGCYCYRQPLFSVILSPSIYLCCPQTFAAENGCSDQRMARLRVYVIKRIVCMLLICFPIIIFPPLWRYVADIARMRLAAQATKTSTCYVFIWQLASFVAYHLFHFRLTVLVEAGCNCCLLIYMTFAHRGGTTSGIFDIGLPPLCLLLCVIA